MNDNEKKGELYIKFAMIFGICCGIVLMITYVLFEKVNFHNDITVGMILLGSHSDDGFSGTSHDAMEKACMEMGVRLVVEENVEDNTESCLGAVQRLTEKGAQAILLNSTEYVKYVSRLMKEYPELSFFCNDAGDGSVCSCATYSLRMYQPRYLAGILAGMETSTNKLGYIVAEENSETLRGINAFALGAQSVNPDIEVIVGVTGEWQNEETEAELTKNLIFTENIDVITYHQDDNAVLKTAEECGIKTIGYHSYQEGCSDNYLGVVRGNWDVVYKSIIKDCINGKADMGERYWLGCDEAAVELWVDSKNVSESIINDLRNIERRLVEGRDVFSGEIYDNQGDLICADKECISDDRLFYECTWLAEGVRVYEEK